MQKLATIKGRPYLDSTDSTHVMIMSHYSSDVQVAVRPSNMATPSILPDPELMSLSVCAVDTNLC